MAKTLTIPSIIAIVLLAAGLRIWGMDWGLPNGMHYFSYHPTETHTLFAAMNINFFDGQLDPDYYKDGSLAVYLTAAAMLVGMAGGLIALPSGDIFSAIGEFAKLYTAGRIVSIVFGVITVYLVYSLARRAYGRGTGILAALLMAIMPIHVIHSKFLAVDVIATFFLVLALIFAVRIPERNRLRDYLLAGLFVGMAAGTSYYAALAIVSPAAAALVTGKASILLRLFKPQLVITAIAAAGGFFIGTPGAVLHSDKFLSDIVSEAVLARDGLLATAYGGGFVHHYMQNLAAGMSTPLLVLATLGTLYAIGRRTPADVVLLAFLLIYIAVIALAQLEASRYIIPLLPIFAIFAARVSVESISRLSKGKALQQTTRYAAIVILTLVLVSTALHTILIGRVLASTDTRDAAAYWIKQHIPIGASIGFPTIPWVHAPPLDPFLGLPDAAERHEIVSECTDYVLLAHAREEWNAGYLEWSAPDYVMISKSEFPEREAMQSSDVRAYLDLLERDYYLTRSFLSPRHFGKGIISPGTLPHDISYASPTILIYTRKAMD